MVAALYPMKDSLEVVLALDSGHENPELIDATHLTWRTMPVLFRVERVGDLKTLNPLFIEAIEGVVTGKHNVQRPAELFRGRVLRISHDPQTGKKIW